MKGDGIIENRYLKYHMHTDYSILDSATKFQEYIDLVVRDGDKSICFTEHGKPMGWVSKKIACDKAGIKYIHGVEVYLTRSTDPENKIRDNYHSVLIAKNYDGLMEINRAVSKSCDKDHFYYTNRMTFDEFINLSDNVITTSACLASPLRSIEESDEYFEKLITRYNYLEIQPHMHEDQVRYNRFLADIARRYGKKLIAGTDTHSSSKYKAECRSMLTKAKRKSYGDEDMFDLTYKTFDELVEMFRMQNAIEENVFMDAIHNTLEIEDSCEPFGLDKSIKYPILYGSREADSEKFEETVRDCFKEKVDSGVITAEQVPAFEDAIKEEMRVFKKLNMDGFMLSMSELIRWCKSNGFEIGTARGSVGGSRVAYVTDIIDMNPETWHTVFSRFCNEDREEIGDIDIDCIESDRPAIFRYITERFGSDYTARVASFGTIKEKGVIDDVGRALGFSWEEKNGKNPDKNPWSIARVAKIKEEFDADKDKTIAKYPELFYYMDGLLDTIVSQSVHPAGMVISPVSLVDNYGMFDKDGENCLFLDMEEAHEVGVAKYDFLVLKTVQVIRDACRYIGTKYPRSHEINWNDENVWEDMRKDQSTIFQFESRFAADSFKKFGTDSIFDMSLVTACIRPTGASYREDLLARKKHTNPSPMIDELLKNNGGYLIYQEDTIAFLQQICGLSGSEADNIRRAIGRKQIDRLEAAMPSILEGYCRKSPQPKEVAEDEAREFLRIIEDSARYQFGYNHSVAYCLLGYLCGYYRYYYPLQYITSYLNNAANDDDIMAGTKCATKKGIQITMPKWGVSRDDYFYDVDRNMISRGLSSVKYIGAHSGSNLYDMSKRKKYKYFFDLLKDIDGDMILDSRQIDILIKIDFFSEFGNQVELLRIREIFEDILKRGSAKKIKRSTIDGTVIGEIIKKYSLGTTKNGAAAAMYTILDMESIMHEIEDRIKESGIKDLSLLCKVRNFKDIMGYYGYTTGEDSDRRKLVVTDVYILKRKKDGAVFGRSFITKSIGSGKESRFTVRNKVYEACPVLKDDIIECKSFERDGKYYVMTAYNKIVC